MSKHWRPDEDVIRARSGAGRRSLDAFSLPDWLGQLAPGKRPKLSNGAKAGLLLAGAACLGVAVVLYQAFGPNDVFERDSAAQWEAVEAATQGTVPRR